MTFDDHLLPNLTDSVKAHLIIAEPAREWYCKARVDDDEIHIHVGCAMDGRMLGYVFALPAVAIDDDSDHEWVDRTARRATMAMVRLVSSMN